MLSDGSVIFPGVLASMSVSTQNFSFLHHLEGTDLLFQSVSQSVVTESFIFLRSDVRHSHVTSLGNATAILEKGKTNAAPIADARTSWFYLHAKPSDLFFSVDVFQINCWYIVFTQVFAMSYQYIEHLWGDALARYRAKIQLIGLDSCPCQYPGDSWIDNPKEWPNVQYPDVCTRI